MTEQELKYDLERCITRKTQNKLIMDAIYETSRQYELDKKNDISSHWPYIGFDDSFIIPEPWYFTIGLDWEEYYDPCITIGEENEKISTK